MLLLALLLAAGAIQAQEIDLREVWVTTQDYSVLRLGPGTHWERLTVLPPGTTLRATGRTFDGRWFQVAYDGPLAPDASHEATLADGKTYGWVAYWLLVWTGNILELPVDGIPTVLTARLSGQTIILHPDSYYYVGEVDPSLRVEDTVDVPTQVELTGRIGTAGRGYYWIQFELNDQYYWTGTWEPNSTRIAYWRLADGTYLYIYGRLVTQMREEISETSATLYDIGSRWRALEAGQPTTCNNIPVRAALDDDNFRPGDLVAEPIFAPVRAALDAAVANANRAIAAFETACSTEGEQRFIGPEDVTAALVFVAEAERQITVAGLLLAPLERRDAVLGGFQPEP